jgi:hypothetical protein
MPLDFIKLSQSHTGNYLDEMVQLVVEKFGVQNKVFSVWFTRLNTQCSKQLIFFISDMWHSIQ